MFFPRDGIFTLKSWNCHDTAKYQRSNNIIVLFSYTPEGQAKAARRVINQCFNEIERRFNDVGKNSSEGRSEDFKHV